jgi:biotin transporter BioY
MTDKRFQKKMSKIKKEGEQYKQLKELQDAYAEYIPEKKTRKVSNIMLIVIIIAIVSYAVANFYLQYYLAIEISPTLTGCWYAFWGTEIVALAAIKTNKVKHESRHDEFYD